MLTLFLEIVQYFRLPISTAASPFHLLQPEYYGFNGIQKAKKNAAAMDGSGIIRL
jgi:hypothetical protein